jgi:hypothetical protein
VTHITPVVIFPPDGLDPIPYYVPRTNIAGTVESWLRPIEIWYDRQRRVLQDNRLMVSFGEVQVLSGDAIDLNQENPWFEVRGLLAARDYLFGENQGQEMTLAYLVGWKNTRIAGQAGSGLAVVGETAWDYAARGDLSYALGLIAHEVGHLVWSLGHSLATMTPPDLLRLQPARLEEAVLYRQDGGQPRVLMVAGPVSCPAEPSNA